MRVKLIHEELTHSSIGAFFEVYHTLGFGLLEHVYVASLERELRNRGHQVGREVSVPVLYKREEAARQRLDMIVDGKVVIEAKSSERVHNEAIRQLTGYLRAMRLEVGLLLHFGPRPRFFRIASTNLDQSAPTQSFPLHPHPPLFPSQPSVVVTKGTAPTVS